MKKVLKRIATMTAVLALIVVTGISMAACGSSGSSNNPNNPGNTTEQFTSICNIDNLNGFYANTDASEVYWFDVANNRAKHAKFSISDEANEEGLYQLRVASILKTGCLYETKIQVNRGTQAVAVYHKWNNNEPAVEDLLIGTYENDYDKDLSKQFYAEDEERIYTKISSLGEFLAEVFPNKEIDTTDMTNVSSYWEDFIKAL